MINPFADPEYFVDHDLKCKDIELREEPKGANPLPVSSSVPVASVVSSYRDLEFEVQASRNRSDKILYAFDESLERLQSAGFERHPRPSEAFTLLADGIEGKLSGGLQKVSEDMLNNYGEWLSLAFERNNDVLICYLDPKGLVWNTKSSEYVKDGFKFAEKKEFNIAGKPSQQWIELAEFSDNLVRFLYGRSFKDLPQDMREGDKKAQLYLPSDGVVWPVARDGFNDGYGVGGGNCNVGASRGVRPAQKFFSGSVGGRK